MYLWLVVGLVTAVTATIDYTTVPELNYDTWWGPGDADKDDTSITPFTIEWPEDVIEDLLYRLKNKRPLTPPLDGSGYNYGTNTDTISYWLDYWQNEYNFTERLAYMNKYPHFKTPIQGLDIHFIHIKPEVPEGKYSIPLMLCHGFPGSIREFYEFIEYILNDDEERDFVLELVVPSLPGFGYSDATNRQGLGAAEMGFILKGLMNRLGHEQFYCQAGDWGSHICDIMATFMPDVLLGFHANLGVAMTDQAFAMITTASIYPEAIMPSNLVDRLYPLEDTLKFMMQEFGYFHIQASKPDTIGLCVGESPTSMVSWFLHLFSFCNGVEHRNETMGGVEIFTRDEFLDNVMVYWVTGRITSAMRIYAETANLRNWRMGYLNEPTTVPTVIVQALNEIYYMPPVVLNTKYTNLLGVEVLDDYGHFLALQAPEVLAKSVLSAMEKFILFHNENDASS